MEFHTVIFSDGAINPFTKNDLTLIPRRWFLQMCVQQLIVVGTRDEERRTKISERTRVVIFARFFINDSTTHV